MDSAHLQQLHRRHVQNIVQMRKVMCQPQRGGMAGNLVKIVSYGNTGAMRRDGGGMVTIT